MSTTIIEYLNKMMSPDFALTEVNQVKTLMSAGNLQYYRCCTILLYLSLHHHLSEDYYNHENLSNECNMA